ncbi:MAG TPA: hypothetical protein VGY58_03275 [Gemmataceae bacterium]|nr:hypothetical protein [Gemmataceae bacterium]
MTIFATGVRKKEKAGEPRKTAKTISFWATSFPRYSCTKAVTAWLNTRAEVACSSEAYEKKEEKFPFFD